MYFYLFKDYENESDGTLKENIKTWIRHLCSDTAFRKQFLLSIVFMMILYSTLLNRNIWLNLLSDVLGRMVISC